MWLSFSQTTETVIDGFEAAWAFFGGVFKVVIPDNMSTGGRPRPTGSTPGCNQAFVEYAQARGFVIDPARVRTPTDKPRVERTVPFVRNSFFAGETFIDLADAQRRAVEWCAGRAGQRDPRHARLPAGRAVRPGGETPAAARPDAPLRPARLRHRQGASRSSHRGGRALYSIPGNLIGARVEVRADRELVRVFYRGVLVKIHPRQAPGGRVTDAEDLPAEKTAYAMRDLDHLRRLAADAGTGDRRLRRRLVGHARCRGPRCARSTPCSAWSSGGGPDRVEAACARALEAEAVSVRADRPDDRTGHREPAAADPPTPLQDRPRAPFRPRPRPLRHQKPRNHKAIRTTGLEAEGGVA